MILRKEPRKVRNRSGVITVGGWCFIFLALCYPILAFNYTYPEMLKGSAKDILLTLQEIGFGQVFWLFLFSFLPLLLIFGAFGLREIFRKSAPFAMTTATGFAIISTFFACIGIARWSVVYWGLGKIYLNGENSPNLKSSIENTVHSIEIFFGKFVGQFMAEISFNTFVLLTALAVLSEKRTPNWLAYLGFLASFFGFMSIFAEINETSKTFRAVTYLIPFTPIWLLVFGVAMLRYRREPQAPAVQDGNVNSGRKPKRPKRRS